MELKIFSKQETKAIFIIFLVLFAAVFINMSVSLRRGRDSIRKDDISAIQKALDTYYQKYRIYPLATDNGEIIGCFETEPIRDKKTGYPTNPTVCKWGESVFENITTMPKDPKFKDGANYLYLSDGEKYQFYISLEGKDEAEYTPAIINKNLQCGVKICNYGREY